MAHQLSPEKLISGFYTRVPLIKVPSINLLMESIALIVLLLSCFVLLFFTPQWGDELYHHHPNVKYLSLNMILDGNSLYYTAYTPLPYIIGKMIYQLSPSVNSLRLFNYALLVSLIFLVYRIGEKMKFESIILVLLILCNPYLLRSSFAYYPYVYGLLFSFIAIYYYFFSNKKHAIIISHIFLGLTVLSQQWILIIVFSLFVNETRLFINGDMDKASYIKLILYKIIFLIPSLILFYFWGGLTHPNYQLYTLKPSFEHLNAVLANFGFAGALIVLYNFKKFLNLKYLFIVFILPIFILSIPQYSPNHTIDTSSGVVFQLSVQVSKFLLIPYPVIISLFIIFGILSLILVFETKETSFLTFLKYVIIGLSVAFTSSTLLGASHIYVVIPYFYLLLTEELKKSKILSYFVISQMFFTALIYIYYYSFLIARDLNI